MPDELLANLLVFTRALKAAGVSVRAGGVPDAIRAIDIVGLATRADVRDALRAVLISRHEDREPFNRIFEQFWRVWPDGARALPQPMHVPPRVRASVRTVTPGSAAAERGDRIQSTDERPVAIQTYSPDEIWRRKDFAAFTTEDLAIAEAAIAKLAWNPGVRVTRRWRSGSGSRIDLRRLLQVNRRNGAEILEIPTRVRRVAPRPLILFCDVSGSMEPYARMLLLFAHALAGGDRTRRSLRVLHAVDTRDPAVLGRADGRRPGRRSSHGRRLVGRHAHRRRHSRVQRALGAAGVAAGPRGAPHQ